MLEAFDSAVFLLAMEIREVYSHSLMMLLWGKTLSQGMRPMRHPSSKFDLHPRSPLTSAA